MRRPRDEELDDQDNAKTEWEYEDVRWMRLMSDGERAATEQQIFMCLMCYECLAGSFRNE